MLSIFSFRASYPAATNAHNCKQDWIAAGHFIIQRHIYNFSFTPTRDQMAAHSSEKLIRLAQGGAWEDEEDWGMTVTICITLVVRNPRQDQASAMLNSVHLHRIGKAVVWKLKLKQTKDERRKRYKDMKYCAQEHTARPTNRKFMSCQRASSRADWNCSEAVKRKSLYVCLHLGKALNR